MKNGLAKLLAQNCGKDTLERQFKNLQIVYKHNEKRFVLTASGNLSKTQKHNTKHDFVKKNKKPCSDLQLSVDKEAFYKSVLSNNKLEDIALSKKNKIVIDFSSPNIAKPFHVGHLRSTIIGNFIANVNEYFNHTVTRLNYLGDWGTQFGLLQYGLKAKNIDMTKLQINPMKTLFDVYVYANKLAKENESVYQEARKYFSEIEQGIISLESWRVIRNTTVSELENVYQRLGIKFDEYHWESDYNGGAIKGLMECLEENGIIRTDSSGKKITTVNNKDVTVLKSDNSTLYLSRDIAALLDRHKKFEFDKILYVVDNGQTDHFNAVFEVVKKINVECAAGCEHVKFGRIKGMSTRSGNVVFLNDILDEAKLKMHEKQSLSKNTRSSAMNDETCDILGTTAVVLNDLKQKRKKDYTFNWDRTLQSEGDSGIKLQYLHCRLWSLEQTCGVAIPEQCDPHYLTEEIIGEVVAELAKFEHILYKSCEEYEACILVGYLFHLAKHVNRMFNELKVKNVDASLASQRLLVFHSARIVIKTALEVLGVKPLHEM